MKRKFYIIGHNPNSVRNVIRCLKEGANAIEPDIRYLPQYDGKFFVYDLATLNRRQHTLKDYLSGLAAALNHETLNLALLAFNLKHFSSKDMESDSLVYMKELFNQLDEYFFKTYAPVPLLLTVGNPSGKTLLRAAKPYLKPNQAVGVNEGDTANNVAYYFARQKMSFSFADGTSSPFASPLKFKSSIKEALDLKQICNELKLVYTWKANAEKTMRYFMDMGVDGMITGRLARLKYLVKYEYQDTIELATAAYNPFA